MLKYTDRLYDGIFGYIYLTEVEQEITNTPIFQRLHHINQLGMANVIFPNAVHTRFAHSLGVLHVMDKMVTHFRKNYNDIIEIGVDEHEKLRLAALLHDLGHFPLSHVGEKAIENVAEARVTREQIEIIPGNQKDDDTPDQHQIRADGPGSSTKLHERLSKKIVEEWRDILTILEKHNFDPCEIANIIVGTSGVTHQTMLLHSELDADRLDYLIRDSNMLGVSYGDIELDHIVSTLSCKLMEDGPIIGVTEKGLHAVEHYILARYFMYSQIIFYPKLYYLESLLKQVYEFMIESADANIHVYNEEELEKIIEENDRHKLYQFNDHYLFYRMRALHDKIDKKGTNITGEEFIINENIKLLLSGQIREPLLKKKKLIEQNDEVKKKVRSYKEILFDKVKVACSELGLPVESVFYDFGSAKPTKMRSLYGPTSQPTDDVREEAIRIIYDNNEDRFLVEDPSTILNHINTKQLQFFYVFVNPIILNKCGVDFEKAKDTFRRHIDLNMIF